MDSVHESVVDPTSLMTSGRSASPGSPGCRRPRHSRQPCHDRVVVFGQRQLFREEPRDGRACRHHGERKE